MIILSLGSNLLNRKENINKAIYFLQNLPYIKNPCGAKFLASKFHETKALMPKNAPKCWDKDFLNIAFKIYNINGKILPHPEVFLKDVKEIESKMGRLPNQPKWSPRIIDIDIIHYNGIKYQSDILTIPHKEYLNRDFVLKPMAEIQ